MHMVGIFYVVFSQELEVTKQAFGILAPSQAHSVTPSTLNGIFFCRTRQLYFLLKYKPSLQGWAFRSELTDSFFFF